MLQTNRIPFLLNIGCGSTYHQDWVNIDIKAHSSEVIEYDLSSGLPFESNSVDACYSSHVLEHLRVNEADLFLSEQFRVLKKGGVIRIVVPDLEVICKNYLDSLKQLISNNLESDFKYEYSLIELYDQTTRESSGGQMLDIWNENITNTKNWQYIIERNGHESVEGLAIKKDNQQRNILHTIYKMVSSFQTLSKGVRKSKLILSKLFVGIFLGKNGVRAFNEGLFRNSGQIHRVMYDRYRLKKLLEKHNFTEIQVMKADISKIAHFGSYGLEMINDKIRKPDSLFMEAIKN